MTEVINVTTTKTALFSRLLGIDHNNGIYHIMVNHWILVHHHQRVGTIDDYRRHVVSHCFVKFFHLAWLQENLSGLQQTKNNRSHQWGEFHCSDASMKKRRSIMNRFLKIARDSCIIISAICAFISGYDFGRGGYEALISPASFSSIFFLGKAGLLHLALRFKRATNKHEFSHHMIPRPMRDLRSFRRWLLSANTVRFCENARRAISFIFLFFLLYFKSRILALITSYQHAEFL